LEIFFPTYFQPMKL